MSFRTTSLVFFGLFVMVFVDLSLAVNLHDLTIEDYVDYVNPPAVHKFQKNGVTILCIKFEDQLALRDEDKYWQSKMSSEKGIKKPSLNTSYSGLENCPEGTVAVREITHEQVTHAGSVSNFLRGMKGGLAGNHTDMLSIDGAKHQYAVVKNVWPTPTVEAVSAHVNVWKPYISSRNADFSLSQIWVASNPANYQDIETIELGWNVYPWKYNQDDRPHFFIYWTSDGYREHGCYNLDCPGFVLLSRIISPGLPFETLSQYMGAQFHMPIKLERHDVTSFGPAWMLKIGDELIGYFPGSLFKSLNTAAQRVDFGGEVAFKNDNVEVTDTHMGSGHYPWEGFSRSAFIKKIEIRNTDQSNTPPTELVIVSNKHCYDIELHVNNNDPELQRHIYFGGPGAWNPLCTS